MAQGELPDSPYLVRENLEDAGYVIFLATDGQEALDIMLSQVQLDPLVADLDMPRMRRHESRRGAR